MRFITPFLCLAAAVTVGCGLDGDLPAPGSPESTESTEISTQAATAGCQAANAACDSDSACCSGLCAGGHCLGEMCEPQCDTVCGTTKNCQQSCSYWEDNTTGGYRTCRTTTCGAQSGLPCDGSGPDFYPPPGGSATGTGGGTPMSCFPGKFGVSFYEHGNFGGNCVTVSSANLQDRYVPWVEDVGFWNDSMSSLWVGSQVTLEWFEHANFSGRLMAAYRPSTSIPNAGAGFNDMMSSFVIRPIGVTLFQHANYGGTQQKFPVGRYNYTNLNIIGNDQASSLKAYGLKVIACTDANWAGQCFELSGSVPYVGDALNDRISSLIVTK